MAWRWLIALAMAALASAAEAGDPPEWTQPVAPFRIVGPIYYVGTQGLGAYLIRTDGGLILLDGTLEQNAPRIEANIRALGFRLGDVKLLLNSHAHFDHAGALSALKQDTSARLLASAGDQGALETGRPPSDTDYPVRSFPPVKVDRVLVDGQPVRLGDVAMTPVVTPGHTPGCTTWLTRVHDGARTLRVVFPCSMTVAGNRLVGNTGYPGIVADFRRSFIEWRAMSADVVLTAHPEIADVLGRERRREGGERDAFIAPDLLPKIVGDARAGFEAELAKQDGR